MKRIHKKENTNYHVIVQWLEERLCLHPAKKGNRINFDFCYFVEGELAQYRFHMF